jgi:hypothetical protein
VHNLHIPYIGIIIVILLSPQCVGFFNVMSIIDIVIGVAVVVPWNIYLIHKMKKESGKK